MCLCARRCACPPPTARVGQCLDSKGVKDALPVGVFHSPHSSRCLWHHCAAVAPAGSPKPICWGSSSQCPILYLEIGSFGGNVLKEVTRVESEFYRAGGSL